MKRRKIKRKNKKVKKNFDLKFSFVGKDADEFARTFVFLEAMKAGYGFKFVPSGEE